MSVRLALLLAASLLPAAASAQVGALTRDPPASTDRDGPATADAQDATTDETPALRPTLREIFAPPSLLGLRPRDGRLSADGRWAIWRWADEHTEEPEWDWWLAPTDGSAEPERLFDADDGVQLRWSVRGGVLIVQRDGWIETLDVDGERRSRPLMQTGPTRDVHLLDDHRALVRTASHDLWLLDLASGERRRLAPELEDRAGELIVFEEHEAVAIFARPLPPSRGPGEAADEAEADADAKTDADERDATDDEPAPRRLHVVHFDGSLDELHVDQQPGVRTRLSPSARWALRQDSERDVQHGLIMADYLTEHVRAVPVRNSLAGDDAETVALTLVDTRDGREHPLPLDGAERYYVQRLEWSPSDDLLLVDRLSNDFHVREILVVDPDAGTGRLIHSARDDAWIGGPYRWSGWSHDGSSVVFTSELTGWNQLYAADPREGEPRALTSGAWELQRLTAVPDSDRWLVVGTHPDDPATIRLLTTSLEGTPPAVLLDDPAVVSSVRVSRDGSTALFQRGTLARPSDLHALRFAEPTGDDGHAGTLLADFAGRAGPAVQPSQAEAPRAVRLTDSVPSELTELGAAPPRIVEYSNPDDGATVRAYLHLPPGVEFGEGAATPAEPLPLVVFLHGAGYLQQVTHSMSSYEVNMLFHQRLAAKGYVVLDPDFRHSKGYGRDFRTDVHGFMGGKDLDDTVAGVHWLAEAGLIDAERVGIYGGSYGGFLTLMALFTKADDFTCGAALRSVTDWRVYNHWYTNPRLGDPERDAEAYARSSPIDHVDGLEDPLLLLHGLVDSNVFAQDTIRLMEELIQRGKDFDAMLYPSQGHGFDDPASWIDEYRRIEALFDEHLR